MDQISSAGRPRWSDRIGRRTRRVVAAAVVTAVGALAVPDLLATAGNPVAGRPSLPPAPATDGPLAPAPLVLPWPPRGDLASSGRFGRQALAAVPPGRCLTTGLVFAGRLPDGSRLALVGCAVRPPDPAGIRVWAVHARAAAAVSTAVVTDRGALVSPSGLLTWTGRGSDGRVLLVVVAGEAADRVQVSGRLTPVGEEGFARRWRTLRASDGVLVTDLGVDAGPVVLARGDPSRVAVADVAYRLPPGEAGAVPVAGLDWPLYRGPPPPVVRRLAATAVAHLVPSHPTVARVVRSATDRSGSLAVLEVRVAAKSALRLVVQAGGPEGGRVLAPWDGLARPEDPARGSPQSVVVGLTDGRPGRVPAPAGERPGLGEPGDAVLAGATLSFAGSGARVTASDWAR